MKRVVLITGASSGLGKEFAAAFSKHGSYQVVLAARRTHLLDAVCQELGGPTCARAVELDVSAGEEIIDAAIEKAWSFFGGIDVIVNNAGIRGTVKPTLELDVAEWDNVFNTNTRGAWLVSKAICKRMVASKRAGSIINISSNVARGGLLPGSIAYAPSKSALNRVTEMMALELGKFNIRVNAIECGPFRSEMTKELFDQEWFRKAATANIPLNRIGEVNSELTSLVLFLADQSSSYVTGSVIQVDGGNSLVGVKLWSSL